MGSASKCFQKATVLSPNYFQLSHSSQSTTAFFHSHSSTKHIFCWTEVLFRFANLRLKSVILRVTSPLKLQHMSESVIFTQLYFLMSHSFIQICGTKQALRLSPAANRTPYAKLEF
jgi:hypothetical protein